MTEALTIKSLAEMKAEAEPYEQRRAEVMAKAKRFDKQTGLPMMPHPDPHVESSIRWLQAHEAPEYPREKKTFLKEKTAPSDCFRCRGKTSDCPLLDDDNDNWRLCPHRM